MSHPYGPEQPGDAPAAEQAFEGSGADAQSPGSDAHSSGSDAQGSGSDAQSSGSDAQGSGYVRLPMAYVAAGLLVLIVALLAFGLWANRNLRPQGAPAVATPVNSPVLVAAAPTAVAATATPVIAPTATPLPAPVVAAPATAPVASTSTVAADTPEPTPLPTVEPALAAGVGQAYENFWRVRSQAELTLDGSHASDVMDGDYLTHFIDVLNQLQQQGRAIKTQVSLNYTVVEASDDIALVHDRIEDTSYYVDPQTEAALSDPAADLVRIEFTLKRMDRVWKVVDSVTES